MKKVEIIQLLAIIFFFFSTTSAQHFIPFASSGNTIELSIQNISPVDLSNVNITPGQVPSWLHLQQDKQSIASLKGKENVSIQFHFSVDKSAPANTRQTVIFTIVSSMGERWTKPIDIEVLPPEQFELFQNFPNPFNPATTIAYQLPKNANVSLIVYNTLGQEVASIVSGNRTAGYHEEVWNASGIASGMYICQLTCIDGTDKGITSLKKMMVVK